MLNTIIIILIILWLLGVVTANTMGGVVCQAKLTPFDIET